MSDQIVDIAVLQLDAEPGDVAGNVVKVVEGVRRYGPAADLVVAPELMTTGYDLDLIGARGNELAEPLDGPSITRMADACAETGTTLIVGFLERGTDAVYDSVAVIIPGRTPEVYRKSHLYPTEILRFGAGDRVRTVATDAAVLGPLICFEHAFPEIATTLALQGAQILVIPSAVPVGFEYLLALRTRARAQDNQIFAVACNMAGHGFCGRSLVADPRGEVLAAADGSESVLRARLNLGAIARERGQEPALRMRRPDLYGRPGHGV